MCSHRFYSHYHNFPINIENLNGLSNNNDLDVCNEKEKAEKKSNEEKANSNVRVSERMPANDLGFLRFARFLRWRFGILSSSFVYQQQAALDIFS